MQTNTYISEDLLKSKSKEEALSNMPDPEDFNFLAVIRETRNLTETLQYSAHGRCADSASKACLAKATENGWTPPQRWQIWRKDDVPSPLVILSCAKDVILMERELVSSLFMETKDRALAHMQDFLQKLGPEYCTGEIRGKITFVITHFFDEVAEFERPRRQG